MEDHWNRIYARSPITQLGWYEPVATLSVGLIEQCGVSKQFPIVDIGSGASSLVANLLALGYTNLYAVDISAVALEKAQNLLTAEQAAKVHWLVDDITSPTTSRQLENIAVWHDRAMLHFLIDDTHRQTYHSLLNNAVMPGGFVILAAFALEGAEKCSGLPVQRYSAAGLGAFLGSGFRLIEHLDYLYRMPSGDTRPYVYARFQKLTTA